jgi:transcriptional regulator with XRE-family HTH domain
MASHPVDVFVGGRLRSRRLMLGLSQDAVGRAIGISFQQVQKYERGINRMGSSRLYEFSRLLNIPVSYFFDGYDYQELDSVASAGGLAEEPDGFEHDTMSSRETLELIRAYYSIRDEKTRKRFVELLKSVAENETAEAILEQAEPEASRDLIKER